ncbi:replication-relaxation family protein [Kitasatospora sp. NPDC006697]|uniref:replication-relaxation family protein n=1 Tax=Kitasatospora sp. NPDC006697 TaxID=3364020 RepID=UPI00368117F9
MSGSQDEDEGGQWEPGGEDGDGGGRELDSQDEDGGGQDSEPDELDGQGDDDERPAAERTGKKRTAFVRAKAYPNGSTGPLRRDILQVLGVLKAATVKQVWQLAAPHHEHPNTVASALRDMALKESRLAEQRGSLGGPDDEEEGAGGKKKSLAQARAERAAAGGKRARPTAPKGSNAKIWGLTELGLDAAAATLPVGRKMGNRARSLGRGTGAPHAMAVNDTIVAFTGANTPGGGIGVISDWTTEASHPLPGGRQQIADAVLIAPADGVPVLLVEVDLHNGTNLKIARKIDGYAEYFAQTYKDPNHEGHPSRAKQLPSWRRTYPTAPAGTLPPIALVLGGAGPRAIDNTIDAIHDLAAQHWEPRRAFDFTDKIPLLACHLDDLKAKGPHAAIWWRYGSTNWQTLTDALANTDYIAATRERIAAEKKAAQEQEHQRLEATRCPGCNRREDEFRYRPHASDGTRLCTDCEEQARKDRARRQLLAARAHNDALHPCYTCHGPLGGPHGSRTELDEPAEADRLECPPCASERSNHGRRPILLDLPAPRQVRRAAKHGPPDDDPWWTVRLLHAERWPKEARDRGKGPS